ncbi:MAG TPA: hypothetical protein PKN26_03250 [Giesbergeria sp.]|nr:hypothetical protein [Giesbergeria sp.]HNE70682.1 hypothetical protein [Giesbergeria sp.]HNI75252.1 hypothetical protein [Giesbergeria sp.]HNK05559.1 hypothetical protein [Giesbergeria sp.]HNM40012.1 hypothetical protein [Giesbergeria sp.]
MKNSDMISNATHYAADSVGHAAHSALDSAQHAVQATRSATDATLDKAESKVNSLRGEVDPTIAGLEAKAQALANKSIQYCARTGERLREQAGEYSAAATHYVEHNPGKSLLMAVASGAALATVVAMLFTRRRTV